VALSKLDSAWYKCVLGRAVDKGNTFLNTGYGKDGGRGDLFMASLNRLEGVVGSVVDTFKDVSVALSVGRSLDDDLVQVIVGFKVSTIC
jgi:hypothetical protein